MQWTDPNWGPKDYANDAGHFVYGFGLLLWAWLTMGTPWALTLCFGTFAQGAVIEFLKETPDNAPDTARDLAGYFFGGLLGGLLLWRA